MSKTRCQCGGTIYDQTDNIPYKGAIVRDQDKMNLYQIIVRDISSFIESILLGKREGWVYENYLKYDQDDRPAKAINNDDVIEFILRQNMSYELCIYQCTSCGSVMIETGPFSNQFASFTANKWKEGSASILQAREEGEGPNFKLL